MKGNGFGPASPPSRCWAPPYCFTNPRHALKMVAAENPMMLNAHALSLGRAHRTQCSRLCRHQKTLSAARVEPAQALEGRERGKRDQATREGRSCCPALPSARRPRPAPTHRPPRPWPFSSKYTPCSHHSWARHRWRNAKEAERRAATRRRRHHERRGDCHGMVRLWMVRLAPCTQVVPSNLHPSRTIQSRTIP